MYPGTLYSPGHFTPRVPYFTLLLLPSNFTPQVNHSTSLLLPKSLYSPSPLFYFMFTPQVILLPKSIVLLYCYFPSHFTPQVILLPKLTILLCFYSPSHFSSLVGWLVGWSVGTNGRTNEAKIIQFEQNTARQIPTPSKSSVLRGFFECDIEFIP